ncbi:hypothetical protein GCM10007857_29890 [Bradyrhizobium iriomotense]|uniref:Uncharacterized protein n=2 Tax=Bradyrhizobium iriomotense TaxID=441950 RepID=A0ABQ6AVT9_9BRAD|nr:hypothetical protein GCM10007857_29890 [Bradyrhizobium iriomotense]
MDLSVADEEPRALRGIGIGVVMCFLTQREIEFLAGLRRRWRKLYWLELARLCTENAVREVQCEAQAMFWREPAG